MKCEEVQAIMIDYLDNTLEEQLHMEIEKHLETCESCLDELKDTQQVLTLISKEEMVKPDDSLRINFYHMLHSEIKKSKSSKVGSIQTSSIPWYHRIQYRIAAGFAILLAGTFLGVLINSQMKNSQTANELKQLKSEMITLKKTAMFSMLKEESSSDRILAMSYADELNSPDENVMGVLIKTLNHDKNVNVRLAAAYALDKYADQRSVCDSLIKSLSFQDEPILQITLINILSERREKSAFKTFLQIIENKGTMKEVKAAAENGVKRLL
jgi:hypothetical protein